MRIQLPKGKAATLEFYPAEGPPSSVSVELLISGSTALVASPSASVDSLGQTLDSAASVDAVSLDVDPTGVVVDRDYWLCTAGGRCELVRAIDTTAATVLLEQPISFAVPTTGTFEGARCYVALSSTDTANRYRRCEARWTYTVNGTVRYATQRFDIVERPFNLNVPESLIETVWPAFGEYKGLRGAWRQHVRYAIDQIGLWLESRQLAPDLCREPWQLERAAAHIVVSRMHIGDAGAQRAMEDADRVLSLLESRHMWYDEDEDLAVDETPGDESAGEIGPRPRYLGVS